MPLLTVSDTESTILAEVREDDGRSTVRAAPNACRCPASAGIPLKLCDTLHPECLGRRCGLPAPSGPAPEDPFANLARCLDAIPAE